MTVVKRGAGWAAYAYVEKKKHYVGKFDTRREATEQKHAFIAERKNRGTASETITEFIDGLIAGMKASGDYKPSTLRAYGFAAKAVKATFGETTIGYPNRDAWRGWGKAAPKGQVEFANLMWNEAVVRDRVEGNPLFKLKRRRKRATEPVALTTAQVRELADTALNTLEEPEASMMRAYILFAAGSMLRPGEIMALRHDAVDVNAGEITVKATRDSHGAETLPKNGLIRTVALLKMAREGYDSLPRRLDSEYVFSSADGQPLTKGKLSYRFREIRREAGLPGFRLYWLRHAGGTILKQEHGLDSWIVAVQAGHTDGGRLVDDTYTRHSTRQQDAIDRLKAADSAAIIQLSEASRKQQGGNTA